MISFVIINYNTRHLLAGCIESLRNQTYRDFEIICIDNDSPDGSGKYIMENFKDVIAVCNNKNIGYAPAGNQGIRLAKGDYVMLLNPDIFFTSDYVEKCIGKMEQDKKIAAICGKIYKYDFEKNKKTDFIDTVGLFCYRNRRVIDDGQGIEDKGQFDRKKEVFGISGACPIYRKESLEDVKVLDEYLDDDFFMYKEDIDISWRFLLFGWKCVYLPSAHAWHGRGTGVLKRFTHVEVYKNRSRLGKMAKYYGYRNQRLMQIKNEFISGIMTDFLPILWKEVLVFGYMTLKEPFLFKAFFDMLGKVPRMLKKRKYIMSHRRVDSKYMEKWLRGKQSQYLAHENTVD